ncbi:MAG: SpoIIE family protein phosphatase [Methylophagaceae bacterium]
MNLQDLQSHYEQNLAIADHLYERIARMGPAELPGLTVLQQPLKHFCSDITLSAPKPSGGINLFLGNFTGQDLAAAVGALPVAEVFYSMSKKGYALSDIIDEINKKLLFVLPEEFFCSAGMIELDPEGQMLAVWNGSLADIIVVDENSNISHRIPPSQTVLGVKTLKKTDLETAFVEVTAGDKLFMSSASIANAGTEKSQQLDQDDIDKTVTSGLLDLKQTQANFLSDQIILELDIAAIQKLDWVNVSEQEQISLPATQWNANFSFSAETLRSFDFVPLLVNIVMQIQAPYKHRQRIYTVLAELCSNALEHGLLKLDSDLKHSANGFSEYYTLRAQRLAELSDSSIKVSLSHQPHQDGGQLTIVVEDSGTGFNYQQHAKNLADNEDLCGRGEGLIKQLCSEFYYSGHGNIAHAEYCWT